MLSARLRIAGIAGHLSRGPGESATDDQTVVTESKNDTAVSAQTSNSAGIVYRTELDPVSFLKRSALVFPTQTAVVYRDTSFTYAQFSERARRLAAALVYMKATVVAVLLPNIPAMLDAYFGVPLSRAVLVPINTRLNSDEIEYILQKSKTDVLIIDKELSHLVTPFVEGVHNGAKSFNGTAAVSSSSATDLKRVIVVEDSGRPENDPYERVLHTAVKEGRQVPSLDDFPKLQSEDDIVCVCFTSGTTGRPKGVMLHYRGAYLNALSELLEMNMTSSSRYLWTLPMFHAGGWCFPWAVTAIGAVHVLLRKIDYPEIWRLLKTCGITHYCAAPTVQTFILNDPARERLPQPVKTMIAGAPPSPTLLGGLMDINITPVHVYGLTETFGPSAVCSWQEAWTRDNVSAEDQARFLSRQGQGFITGDMIRVVDPITLKDVPRDGNTMGEVVFTGNLVMAGYLHDKEASDKAFKGGVFHSGDLGVMHADGYVELRDRMKDIIISGGENISTIEVENAVSSHPQVLEACVVSSPDSVWGERPVVYLTLRTKVGNKEDEEALKTDIFQHLRQRLAGFKMPKAINVMSELPKTSTGKIQKYVVRQMEWAKNGHAATGVKKIN